MSARTKRAARAARPLLSRLLLVPPLLALACGGQGGDAGADATDMPAAGASVAGLPDTIRIRQPGLHPECVEWDAPRDRFLVSSATTGAITAVRDDGSHSVFIDDPEVVGSIGIHIDSAGGRLLVASSDMRVFEDSSFPGRAALGIYDLESGERIRMVDLGALRPEGRHFANDLTVDGDGTVYVTDSFSPVIYRVALDGTASILVEDERLSGEPIGLNGIEFHPDGYLLAAVMGRRTLVRVPLDEPSGLTDVSLDEPVSADGITRRPDGSFVAMGLTFPEGGEPRAEALLLESDDGWTSARIVARAATPSRPTTATLRGDAVYVVTPHFTRMGGAEPVQTFEIFRVDLR